MGGIEGGSSEPATDGAGLALRALCEAALVDPDDALARSFLLRTNAGPLEAAAPSGGGGRDLRAGLDRLREAVDAGHVEDAGEGYLLVVPAPVPDGPTWLVRIRDGRLAVAFEFERHADAASAVPPRLSERSGVEIVEAAIWALAKRDVSTVLSLLDDDFTYTDAELGLSLTGAATAINQLLLLHEEIDERILIDLRYRDLGHGIIEVTGRVVEPENPTGADGSGGDEPPGRWRIIEYIENGRIKSTTRYPDLPG